MKRTQYVLALALVLVVAAHGHAQTITLTAGKGTGAKTISVKGTLTPPVGYHPGKVTVQRWAVSKTGSQVEQPDVLLTPALSGDKTTWTYGPADIRVTVGSAPYNVVVKVTYYDDKDKAYPGGAFFNHGTATSSAP